MWYICGEWGDNNIWAVFNPRWARWRGRDAIVCAHIIDLRSNSDRASHVLFDDHVRNFTMVLV